MSADHQISDDIRAIIAEFFHDQPDALDGCKTLVTCPGGTPEVCMNMPTTRRFIHWALRKGYVGEPARATALLSLATQMEHGEHDVG